MLARILLIIATVCSVCAFSPSFGRVNHANLSMNIQNKISKAIGVAALGISFVAPVMPVFADGAVSASTVYRARTTYGRRIQDLKDTVSKANFEALQDRKVVNSFDLFISGANALNADKSLRAAETAVEAKFFAAVKAKDAGKLKSAYDEFIQLADLTKEFKPNELGQTDSSGYSGTWGTDRQYIYQR